MNSTRLQRNNSHVVDKPKKPFQFITVYIIHDPCVITDNQILKVNGKYDLVDFLDNAGIEWVEVKLINVNKKDNTLQMSLLDLKTKQVIQRSKQIDNNICDWVITNLFPTEEELINDYCENN